MPRIVAKPTHCSPIPRGVDLTSADLGATMLGLPLLAPGRRLAGLLEARSPGGGLLYDQVAIQQPRRSSKTSTIMAVLIGRAMTRPGYRVIVTAQSGTIASRLVIDAAEALIATGYCAYARERANRSAAPVVFSASGGREALEFANRSRIWAVTPTPAAVRSQAADAIFMDEGGEHDPVKSVAFGTAVMPTMDTRDEPQFLVAGTPGLVRAGLFWDWLEIGRADPTSLGIIDYAMAESDDVADEKVWRRVHPGLSAILPSGRPLTPIAVLRRRFAAMKPDQFAREYGGRWATDPTAVAIDPLDWLSCAGVMAERPDRFCLAFDCAPDGSRASLVAAWRTPDDVAHVEVIQHRAGTGWVAKEAYRLARRYKMPVAYDPIGANADPADALTRARPTIHTEALTFRDMQGAASRFVKDVAAHTLSHGQQPDLDEAVAGASWREVGESRLFGRRRSTADVTALVAATAALWHFDKMPARSTLTVVTRRTG